MEYGLYVADIGAMPSDPRLVCAEKWHTVLPPAPLRAIYFGTEFCEALLPAAEEAEGFCAWARGAGVESVLLTPVVTARGLARCDRLLQALVQRGCTPEIVCNDWGVLELLRRAYPDLPRRAGRLMNRGLRDPRLLDGTSREAVRSRERGGRFRSMLVQLGVRAIESDPDLDGAFLGAKVAGLQRVLHFPYVFAATGRNCLIQAESAPSSDACFTKGLGLPCTGGCRERLRRVERGDVGVSLWRAGNTIFYEVPMSEALEHLAHADRVVLYERPTA
jgi:hypothetical protein